MTNINDIFSARDCLYLDMVKFLTRLLDDDKYYSFSYNMRRKNDQLLEENKRIDGMGEE